MKLWVNDERTVLVRIYDSGLCEVCTRESADAIWGPPIRMRLEVA